MRKHVMFGPRQCLFGLKAFGLAALLSFAPPNASSAATVDFTTTTSILGCGGASDCTPGIGNVINFGLSTGGPAFLQVTYSANIANNVNVSPMATANFGQLFLLCVSCAGATGSFDLSGATLNLNVAQGADPFLDSGTFGTGAFGGALTLTNGAFGGVGALLFPEPATFALSDGSLLISYLLQQVAGFGSALTINEATTFQGLIEATELSEVPLPGALPLFATGLGALGLLHWRRKRKQLAA